ncbi:ABC transporter ATP-binding protein [Clostridia bacterium]|nr:ABC transporter ATP-binding protein [Clostridia bacterium]
MAKVTLHNIMKVYPAVDRGEKPAGKKNRSEDFVAVRDFNLEVSDNEFIVFVGPSGCGKSTTLRMIAGLEEITEGEFYIDDELVNDVAPKDRNIAMVFQNYALYPHMTVYNNMAFSLKLRKEKKEVIDQKVRSSAELLDITELLHRKPKTLSGGQRQRVAIGRAIVRDPKVFLMDEPLSNLDTKLRNQMRAEIIKLRERIQTTFIYVTHDQIEAMTLGDRIVVMNNGQIQQIGTPQEVFDDPSNLFVAGFIGTPQMNFFNDEKLLLNEGKYYITLFDQNIELPQRKQEILKARNQEETDVVVGIRPPHITISDNGTLAELDIIEMMGSELHLHLNVDGKDIIVVTPTTATDLSTLHKHQQVKFSFHPELIHIFDKEIKTNLFSL